MRKKLLLAAWLLVPVGLLAYHYGPGQKGVARDSVAALIERAQQCEKAESWASAIEFYGKALASLPADQIATRHQLRLAQARARMFTGGLPEAMADIENLLLDMQTGKAEPTAVREARASLGTAQYYAGWLMRLEGASKDEWMPVVESARQNFRLLAEETRGQDSSSAVDFQKNLEATIRLARMDISELQGLPLPKECKNCSNCSQKTRKQRESIAKKPSEKEPKDARGAGVGKRPEGAGS